MLKVVVIVVVVVVVVVGVVVAEAVRFIELIPHTPLPSPLILLLLHYRDDEGDGGNAETTR